MLSFIPEANDGISISNRIAYWIIGEGEWSTNAFQSAFVTALYLTCGLILAYPITLAIEANKKNRQRNWR